MYYDTGNEKAVLSAWIWTSATSTKDIYISVYDKIAATHKIERFEAYEWYKLINFRVVDKAVHKQDILGITSTLY